MAQATPAAVTAWEAIVTLAPLIGAGGLTTIILTVFGRRSGRKGGEEERGGVLQQTPTMAFAALYADRAAIDHLAGAFDRQTSALDRQTDAIKDQTDSLRMFVRAFEEMSRRRR